VTKQIKSCQDLAKIVSQDQLPAEAEVNICVSCSEATKRGNVRDWYGMVWYGMKAEIDSLLFAFADKDVVLVQKIRLSLVARPSHVDR
jgi:hypothetical protein